MVSVKATGKRCVRTVAALLSHPIFLATIYWARQASHYFYTHWKIGQFAQIGTDPQLFYPLYLKGGRYISIGRNFIAGYRTRIEAWDAYGAHTYTPRIIIGDNVCFNYDCHVGAINSIEIGSHTLIGSRVLIIDHDHGDPKCLSNETVGERALFSKGVITIGENVWIGEGACILAGVSIGSHCIIAAGSVVTRSVPEKAIVAGSPAKIISTRS